MNQDELIAFKEFYPYLVEGMTDQQVVECWSDSPTFAYFRLGQAKRQFKQALIDLLPAWITRST
jgi:hypothetical protein